MVPFAPEHLRMQPGSEGKKIAQLPPQDELMKHVKNPDMVFNVIQEPWNEYELEDGTHQFVKAVAVIITSTELFDSGEEPVYLITHQLLTKSHPMT